SFDALILFSGDSDYKHLLRRLQANKKSIVVTSTQFSVSRELLHQADKYIDLRKIRKEMEEENESPSFGASSSTGGKNSLATAIENIARNRAFVNGGEWEKAEYIKEGDFIAVA